MDIIYQNHFLIRDFGILVPLNRTTRAPHIRLHSSTSSDSLKTLIMFDPNAVGGLKIHWFVVNIDKKVSEGTELLSYEKPSPPLCSGMHHYYFWLMEQKSPIAVTPQNTPSRRPRDLLHFLFRVLPLQKNVLVSRMFRINRQEKRCVVKK